MKRPLVVLIVFIVMGIAGLQILTYQAPSQEYLDLQDQFNLYLGQDFSTESNFIDYLNALELEHANENVKIDVTNNLVNTTLSGVIVHIDAPYVYVVTQSDAFINPFHIYIHIHDYKNRVENASVVELDDANHMVLLKFASSNTDDLKAVTYASYQPLQNEVISSISATYDILNHISLGIYQGYDENEILKVDIETSSESIGSSIYDINLQLIGIRAYIDQAYVVIPNAVIISFVNQYI
ncbi:MAG: hypothetical protein AB7E61_05540 [Acholeplasmataceae bacterium]